MAASAALCQAMRREGSLHTLLSNAAWILLRAPAPWPMLCSPSTRPEGSSAKMMIMRCV